MAIRDGRWSADLPGPPRGEAMLAAVYEAHGPMAWNLAWAILGDARAAEQAVADVFAELWREAAALAAEGCDIEAWLAARLRSRALEAKRSLPARAPVRTALPCPAPANPAERPSGRKSERAECVARAVADLPAAQRRTVELAYFGGLTVREIAAQRNEGEAEIIRDLRAALDALRAALLPRGAVAGDTVGGP